jgi:hypothetical protein
MNVCGKYFHTFFNYDGLSAYATNKYSDNGIRTVNIETLVQQGETRATIDTGSTKDN